MAPPPLLSELRGHASTVAGKRMGNAQGTLGVDILGSFNWKVELGGVLVICFGLEEKQDEARKKNRNTFCLILFS